MDAIFDHPSAERDELHRFRSASSAWIFSVSLLLLISASSPALAGKPAGKVGAKPPAGTSQILPIRLGLPDECSSSAGYGMNDASLTSGQLVVVGQGNCSTATKPVRWQNGQWTDVFSFPISGIATDASNDSPGQTGKATVSGFVAGNDNLEFAQSPGSVPVRLPRLEGTTAFICHKLRISGSGEHITGCVNGPNFDEVNGVRWSWSDLAGWQAESLGLNFYPRAISRDGSVIVGNLDEQVKLWLSLPGGGGESLDVGNGFAEDINFSHEGSLTMVVGYRANACSGACTWYPVPVYWKETKSGWVRYDLSALDGVDSKAIAVADVDGKLVIVGTGFTRKDAIQRAVAWIPDSNGNYGQPLRLDAIDGRSKSWAVAVDINSNGVVLGNSHVGGWSHEAVLWILPK
jgi:hypothetical protein